MKKEPIVLREAFYKDFIEKTAYMILIVDEKGRLIHMNQAFEDAIGLSDSDSHEISIWQYIHPYSKALCKERFEAVKSGDRFDLVLVFKKTDGSLLYADGKFNCDMDSKSGLLVITGILQDATELNTLSLEFSSLKLQLEGMNKFWRMLHDTYIKLINSDVDTFDQCVVDALECFGSLVYADRAYIFKYDFDHMTADNTYEWCAEGIKSKKEVLQNLKFTMKDDWLLSHLSGMPVYIEHIDKLHDDDYIKRVVKPFDVKSMVTFPMGSEGKLYGSIGFDSVKIYRSNADYELKILAELSSLFFNAIQRYEITKMLGKKKLTDKL